MQQYKNSYVLQLLNSYVLRCNIDKIHAVIHLSTKKSNLMNEK